MDRAKMKGEWHNLHVHPSMSKLKQNGYCPPPYFRYIQRHLNLESFLNNADCIFKEEISDPSSDGSSSDEEDSPKIAPVKYSYKDEFSSKEWQEEQLKFYNFKSIGKERLWLQDVLLADESTDDSTDEDEEDEEEITSDQYVEMLKLHVRQREISKAYHLAPDLYQGKYAFYGSSLVLEHDKYRDKHKIKRNKTEKSGPPSTTKKRHGTDAGSGTAASTSTSSSSTTHKQASTKSTSEQRQKQLLEARAQKQLLQQEKDVNMKRRKLWNIIVKKEIPKASRVRANRLGTALQTLRKVAQTCQRERRKEAIRSQKVSREGLQRARKMAKEMLLYWRRFDKVEKEHRKKAEKEAMEQRRLDEEMHEMKRQQRKLNFLITQTELYAHFMGKKMKGIGGGGLDTAQNDILRKLEDDKLGTTTHAVVSGGVLVNNTKDDYDSDAMKTQAVLNAQNAVLMQERKISAYDGPPSEKKSATQSSFDHSFSLANTSSEIKQHPQPKKFEGVLKTYQLKGMNWIANLYEQGINGILADEMGLGKTVQSIAFLAYLAEVHDIWGPFLIVAPASTLHNWQQEFTRFFPAFKVLPYWGDTGDRKSLRKFWNQKSSYMNDSKGSAAFHVLITSYQLIVQDVKYFQRIKWQYLVLDEAHAIKSSASIRWKILLGYNCRNRLLLTGTPIQNTMAELWALLHFIMPTLFDNHEEFNEWFSKDIENHASERKPSLDQNQLSRLHMILKPFMLRRVKKDVENELSEKIEVKVMCEMSARQKLLYQAVKNKIMYEDLLQSAKSNANADNKTTSILMNLVMQFRKVCNHPEIFERKEPTSGLHFRLPAYLLPKFLFRNGFLSDQILPSSHVSLVEDNLQIWNPSNIQQSLKTTDSCFSFTRFIDVSPNECHDLFKNLVTRLGHAVRTLKLHEFHSAESREDSRRRKYLTRRDLLIYRPRPSGTSSSTTCSLCFVKPNSNFSTYQNCMVTEWKTTRKNKCSNKNNNHSNSSNNNSNNDNSTNNRNNSNSNINSNINNSNNSNNINHNSNINGNMEINCNNDDSFVNDCIEEGEGCNSRDNSVSDVSNVSDISGNLSTCENGDPENLIGNPGNQYKDNVNDICRIRSDGDAVYRLTPVYYPRFLTTHYSKVRCPPREIYCCDRSAAYIFPHNVYGSPSLLQMLRSGTSTTTASSQLFRAPPSQGLEAAAPCHGWSSVKVPDRGSLLSDCGKLMVLDQLLTKMKKEDHRVLIYSQMTKMIDILEEFMKYRKHKYMRLDGSSKISDRRDMVADFQSKDDIFAFLLSTRAGGLGINLTAADTVIFYDSDWNPTVDQQAMDRAHRLGQTRQVTVYRLVTKGTVEEKILNRAREKSEIQNIVISGGQFNKDVLRPKEVVSLLLDDEELETKLKLRQVEKKAAEENGKRNGRKRKTATPLSMEVVGEKKLKTETSTAARTSTSTTTATPVLKPSAQFRPVHTDDNSGPSGAVGSKTDSDSTGSSSRSSSAVAVDTTTTTTGQSQSTAPTTGTRGRGRGGARGRGSKSKSGTLAKAAASAAAAAGAAAGSAAAYAAYGYSFQAVPKSSN